MTPFQSDNIDGYTKKLRGFSLAVYRHQIYKIGGYNGEYDHDIQCYDPDTDSWHLAGQIRKHRFDAGTFVHEDSLYVIGGASPTMDDDGRYISPPIECFNADSQTFSLVG